MKMNILGQLLEKEVGTVVSWRANPIHRHDGQRKLRCGQSTDRVVVPERRSSFQYEATFSRNPLAENTARPEIPLDGAYKRVLIADDDLVVRRSLAAVLESEGYIVDEARSGIEAVTRAIQNVPDLVLLDLNMPHWDGWTAFSQLDRVAPLLPVIVITARPNQYKKAVELGVDAFMEKPLNIPTLIQAVKRLIAEERRSRARRITKRAIVTELLSGSRPE